MNVVDGILRQLSEHDARIKRLASFVLPPLSATIPIGGILSVPSAMTIPAGWLACAGGSVDAGLYPVLHSICATLPNPTAETGCKWLVRAK